MAQNSSPGQTREVPLDQFWERQVKGLAKYFAIYLGAILVRQRLNLMYIYNPIIKKKKSTCLFTKLDRVWPGPNRVSDCPVSAENIIYEDFVLMGN